MRIRARRAAGVPFDRDVPRPYTAGMLTRRISEKARRERCA